MRHSRQGFTLVELSIVLIIIGLIVGGILAGKDMIRAAELRSVINDKQKYETAINVFKEKYSALPGDMNNATEFWSGTSNGNGNGRIVSDGGWGEGSEGFMAWQHLSNSGLIPGNYSGSYGPAQIGNNVPAVSFSGTGFQMHGQSSVSAGADNISRYGHHTFLWGRESTNSSLREAAISSTDAWGIDNKIDDGVSDSGRVIAFDGWNGAAHSTGCNIGSIPNKDYNLQTSGDTCGMQFIFD